MNEFEELLAANKGALERYVYYKLPSRADADDVIQETLIAAYRAFAGLKNTASFKAWLISIARNKCRDYFARRARALELPLDSINERVLGAGRRGPEYFSAVSDTLERLGDSDKQILYLFYFKNIAQAEISRRLNIPVGTVKSRLHTAKRNFKREYPRKYADAEVKSMKKLPEYLPEYAISKSDKPPFAVVWEELMGWFLVPRAGEKLTWGMYDLPSRKCSHVYDMRVTGRAEVHGIEGVELTARENDCTGKAEAIERTFVAQLTDTHCRYLACMRTENGVRRYITFLDGDAFMPNWGFGEDNCGNETHIAPRGDIAREGDAITSVDKPFLLDVVGRYEVAFGARKFDTVCVMDVETYEPNVVSEQYIDKNGRTVLWRRFNRDDWAIDKYGSPWSARLPDNARITVNGTTYVEWYDCITDYAL